MSISSIGSATSRIQSLLQSQVSAGTIPSGDQGALTSAISDIGTAIQSSNASTGQSSMKDQVNGLIDNEVSNGKLTNGQATELKGLFEKAHAHMHHAHGSGGSALSSLLGSDDSDGSTSGTTTPSTSTDPLTSLAGGASSIVDGLASFVGSLRSAVSSNGLYGAEGATAARIGSVLVNKLA